MSIKAPRKRPSKEWIEKQKKVPIPPAPPSKKEWQCHHKWNVGERERSNLLVVSCHTTVREKLIQYCTKCNEVKITDLGSRVL